jgi:hypothetical protein
LQPRLEDSVRRQVLADLGIEVWRVRVGPAAASDPTSAAQPRSARRGTPQPAPDRHARPPGTAPAAAAASRGAGSASPAVAPFSILAVSLDGVTLLMAGRTDRRTARLAADLLAAAAGRWPAEPTSRQFDWPPPGGLPEFAGREAASRALLAFVDKILTDHSAWLVLTAGALAQQLPGLTLPVARLAVPDLRMLGQDPAGKRQIWAAIERLRLEVRQAGSTAAAPPPGGPQS